ncbi:hypothetical protein VIBNIFTn2_120240 [Vibrio nigripulchritudo FTn2]|uniref:TraC family protein n=1 Tax=Vibrio nigripulchritudo TaxID=28173 RepID=UPI0003B1EAB1|nr:TraC family protein [Vibrio nigripulchritudo]CCN40258.1 hypothetical protein VIBNIFTn2_120240 [Vibrio nigripulchritudo FTn2]
MKEYNAKAKKLLERNEIANMMEVRSFEQDKKLFYIHNNDKNSHLGAMWICNPVSGVGESTIKILESSLATDYPQGTFISFHLISSPLIQPLLRHYRTARENVINDTSDPDKAKLVKIFVENRIAFLEKFTKERTKDETKLTLNDKFVIATVKLPCAYLPTEDDISFAQTQCYSLEQTLDSLNLLPQRLDQKDYLGVVRSLVNIGEYPNVDYDPNRTLNEQIFSYEDELEIQRDKVILNDRHIKSLSVHFYPEQTLLPVMSNVLGDKNGSQNQITCPFMLSTTIYYPEQHSKIGSITKNANSLSYQSTSNLARFSPILKLKDHGYQHLLTEVQKGGKVVQCWTNILLFGKDDKEATEQARQAKNWFEVCNFNLKEDVMFSGPAFQQQLPFNCSVEMVGLSRRFHTMTSKMAAHVLPVVGDWKGNGIGANEIFFSRRGQVQLWCPFDSETNMNGFISGDSGAGKSVFSQGIVLNLWSRGTMIRIIDSGRSYLKLTRMVKGEFIEFSGASRLVINPFSDIKDIVKEMPPLLGVLEQMCAPKEGLSDFQIRMLEKYTMRVFQKFGNDMTITDLAEALGCAKNEKISDSDDVILNMELDDHHLSQIHKMGHQFFAFTRHGLYGRFFDGKSNLTMSGDWSVLELDDLRDLPELQTIVLMMLIIKMNRDYYLADRSIMKALIVDEAWRFLGSEGSDIDNSERIQKYIIGSFRLFRKLNSSIIIITQSPLDLAPDGNSPIIQNSANIIILKQKESTFKVLEHNRVLSIGDHDYQQLKTVDTVMGKYAEAFIYTSGRGYGICRYILDRFTQLLTTSHAKEQSGIDRFIDQGMSVGDAIYSYMKAEGSLDNAD